MMVYLLKTVCKCFTANFGSFQAHPCYFTEFAVLTPLKQISFALRKTDLDLKPETDLKTCCYLYFTTI